MLLEGSTVVSKAGGVVTVAVGAAGAGVSAGAVIGPVLPEGDTGVGVDGAPAGAGVSGGTCDASVRRHGSRDRYVTNLVGEHWAGVGWGESRQVILGRHVFVEALFAFGRDCKSDSAACTWYLAVLGANAYTVFADTGLLSMSGKPQQDQKRRTILYRITTTSSTLTCLYTPSYMCHYFEP